MKRAIINLGCIVSGDWRAPLVDGDAILIDGEKIAKVGSVTDADLQDCDLVVDANGVTAGPGLIDSHVHIAFGDYSPRLRQSGFCKTICTAVHHSNFGLRGACPRGAPHG